MSRLTQNDRYRIKKYWRTNQDTAINQRPLVRHGQKVKAGDVLADGSATEQGQLALGANVTVAFMPWYYHNFEDAIALPERLVKDDVYSSIHIQEVEQTVRDTKRGPKRSPGKSSPLPKKRSNDLDERGIVRIGAHVKPGDILVGKITPKGETELSPEEKLLTAIFGEKAKDVKDSSLKVSPGMEGVVIDVKIFSRIEDQVVEKDRGRADRRSPPARGRREASRQRSPRRGTRGTARRTGRRAGAQVRHRRRGDLRPAPKLTARRRSRTPGASRAST